MRTSAEEKSIFQTLFETLSLGISKEAVNILEGGQMPVQSYSRSVIRLASLLLVALMTCEIALAQNSEVLITVTGPWAYMQDPDNKDRIVIMAPDLTGHGHYPAQIYPWPDGQNGSLLAGQYKLVIENQGTCDAQAPHGAEQKATFFPLPKHFPQPGVDQ